MNLPAGFVILDQVAVDKRLFTLHFACQLASCNGACCVEGEAGAPLQTDEAYQLAGHLDQIRPFASPNGQEALSQQGAFVKTADQDLETPLVSGKECAYAFFEKGIARCGIEAAKEAGVIEFSKPISCHLYPIRVYNQTPFEYLVYEEWDICHAACSAGTEQAIRVYEFVKHALIRKYGTEFYERLDELGKAIQP